MAGVAVLFLIALSVQVLARPQGRAKDAVEIGIYVLWGVFAIDYLVRLRLAPDRPGWFIRHLVDLAAVALPFLRPLRLLRLPYLFGKLHIAGVEALRGRLIVYTAFSAVLLTYLAALVVLEYDRPIYNNFGQALWWSTSTVATLGYGAGELGPRSTEGRAVAVALGLGGICLIAVVTATFSSWFVQQFAKAEAAEHAVTATEIAVVRRDLIERIDRLAAEVRELKHQADTTGSDTLGDHSERNRLSP